MASAGHHIAQVNTLWWIPAGDLPSVTDAEERVEHLRIHDPTPFAVTFRTSFPAPDRLGTQAPVDDERPLCPSG